MAKIFGTLLILSIALHQMCAQDPAPVVEPVPGGAVDEGESKVYPVDEDRFNSNKERVCNLVPQLGGDKENVPAWSDEMTPDEVFELALLNLGYGLSTDAVAHLPKTIGWRKNLIDSIAYISSVTCDTDAIPSQFINGVKNLFLYYLIKRERSLAAQLGPNVDNETFASAVPSPEWKEVLDALADCAQGVQPISLGSSCGQVETYMDRDGVANDVGIIFEQFDQEFRNGQRGGFDIIVDSMWWMFSITYARCYSHFYPNEDIVLEFHGMFRDDIISQFQQRWRGAGDMNDQFSIILGPVDADESHINLRKCSVAAYNYEGLNGRHLVRPVIVTVDNTPIRNFKQDF